ncbi:MAG: hypothetical protein U0939_07685 [Pirellulales bacterium]
MSSATPEPAVAAATEPEVRPPHVARIGGTLLGGVPELRFIEHEGVLAPAAPNDIYDTGLEPSTLDQLAIKIANLVAGFTTEWITRRLGLPLHLVQDICVQLKQEKLIEVLGEIGPFNYRYAITQRGRDTASRLMDLSGYTGPAPVSLQHYTEMLAKQASLWPGIDMNDAERALGEMVVTKETVEIATLAASSGRGLFVFGPAGNGKTSLGRCLQRLMRGALWIPHAISIDNAVIRMYDSQMHRRQPGFENIGQIDQRWACIERPFIVTGGEMTLEDVDLAYQPVLRCYEAPAHVKANGGVFMIDDFGRQRVDPKALLNRWIVPLEERVDFLTLNSGQKIRMPFKLLLIIATNLTPGEVADPAFLRRMGYRLRIEGPTPPAYRRIFERYAASKGITLDDSILNTILERYQSEDRPFRGCEPRDLLERALDVFRLRGGEKLLTREVLDLAWFGYFGGLGDLTAPPDTIQRSAGRAAP